MSEHFPPRAHSNSVSYMFFSFHPNFIEEKTEMQEAKFLAPLNGI